MCRGLGQANRVNDSVGWADFSAHADIVHNKPYGQRACPERNRMGCPFYNSDSFFEILLDGGL